MRPLKMNERNVHQTVFFDLDSTLCDTSHRAHLINQENKELTDWVAYSMGCADDKPFDAAIRLVQILHEAGYYIVCLSGRDDAATEATKAWLAKHDVPYDELHLRDHAGNENHRGTQPDYKRYAVGKWVEEHPKHKVEFMVDDWPPIREALKGICPVLVVNPMYGTPESPMPVAVETLSGEVMEAEAVYEHGGGQPVR